MSKPGLVAALLLAAATAHAQPGPTVFIGGVGARFATLADPAVARPLQAARIGLYEHANGMAPLSPDQRKALLRTWPGPALGEVGGFVPIETAYVGYFGGAYPPDVNMNVTTGVGDGSGTYVATPDEAHPGRAYTGYVTAQDLAAARAAIDAARAAGARTVAIVVTPNGGGEDLDDPFATSPYWAHVRAAALHGGAIALDPPPAYLYLRGPAYEAMVIQMLRFARLHGLRSSLIVSPYPTAAPDTTPGHPACGVDPTFLANTTRLVADLRAAHALPTQWVVENYTATPGCNGNDVGTGPDSLDAVALLLARLTDEP